MTTRRTLRLLGLLLVLAGCAAPPVTPPAVAPAAIPADAADAWYAQAAAQGHRVLDIDGPQSLIAITVRRGGSLARLGHDHLVASHTLAGHVAPQDGRADMHFRLDALTVDEPALRAAAQLDTQPTADAIAGTRTNMLTRVLDAEHFPLVLLHVERTTPQAPTVRLTITLHGVRRAFDVPVHVADSGGTLDVDGELNLLQTDFGITPMSVLGGAIAVQDQLALRFRIVARPR